MIEISNILEQKLNKFAFKVAIITDDRVADLYGNDLLRRNQGAYLFSFPHGEKYKTRATKEYLENQLLENRFSKDSCIIALGGGVVTDIAGYIAATYCRGIGLVMMPTTLLGMVDASIGGKNGVNTPYGKNMIGCMYQPHKIIIDLATLKTLPNKEFANGVVEMIKHGLIANLGYFETLEKEFSLKDAIIESCRIKHAIVQDSEKEKETRHLLNFGHTVGHALEHVTEYALSHGESVAIGMLVESYIAFKLGSIKESLLKRIKQCLSFHKLPLYLPPCDIGMIMDLIALDKKSLNAKPRFVIIGKTPQCVYVEESLVREALMWMKDELCCH